MPIINGKKFSYNSKKGKAAIEKLKKYQEKYQVSANPVKKFESKTAALLKAKQGESYSKRRINSLKKKVNDKVLSAYSKLSPKTQQNLFRLQKLYSRSM